MKSGRRNHEVVVRGTRNRIRKDIYVSNELYRLFIGSRRSCSGQLCSVSVGCDDD